MASVSGCNPRDEGETVEFKSGAGNALEIIFESSVGIKRAEEQGEDAARLSLNAENFFSMSERGPSVWFALVSNAM